MEVEQYPVISLSLLIISKKIEYLIKQYNKNNDFSNNELHILIEIFRHGGSCSNDYLLHSLYCSKSLLSKYVVQLSERGFIECEKLEENRKYKYFTLTEKSKDTCGEAYKRLQKFNEYIFSDFTAEEKNQCTDYCKRFFENIRLYPGYAFEAKVNWPETMHYILRIGYRFQNFIHDYSRGYERKTLQNLVLLTLHGAAKELTYKEIEAYVWNEQSMVSRAISLLEKAGLVTTFTDKNNKKVKKALITEEGNRIAENGLKYATIDQENGLVGFSEAEKDNFKQLLFKINEKITNFN